MHFVLKLSKLCNLRCTYCSEYDELALKERMPLERLEYFVRSVTEFALKQRELGRGPKEFCFVLHGGEPLLLPDAYLSALRHYQHKFLDSHEIPYTNGLQTNLYHVTRAKIEHLQSLGIRLGISVDVFGEERLTLSGTDSQDRVLENLQMLNDIGYLENPGVGAISVLHKGNIANAERIYDFFNELRLSFRFLPLESGAVDVAPSRFRHLMITNEEKVAVFKRIAERHARLNKGITVRPLDEYYQSARRYLANTSVAPYDFPDGEWALIINTNGDAYNSGDEYRPRGYMGNVFRQRLVEIFESEAYGATVAMRRKRMAACDACRFRTACTRIPIAEMHACERDYEVNGALRCAVAFPMITDYVERSRSSSRMGPLLEDTRAAIAVALPPISSEVL
jgi:uncharacterized protein